MSSEFSAYERMQRSGASLAAICTAARASGIDQIRLLRLLRVVCGLSLKEAKEVCGADDIWNDRQDPQPGKQVYWEGASTEDGFYLVEARVTRVVDGLVHVEDHKQFRLTQHGLEEAPMTGVQQSTIPAHYFDRTLAERVGQAINFWQSLSAINSELHNKSAV